MKRRARSCANTPCPASSRFWSRCCITSLTIRQGAGLNPDFAASRNCLRRGARPSASPLFRAGRPALFLPHRRRADVHHRRRHHPPHISRADLTLSRRPPVRNRLWYPDERRAAEFLTNSAMQIWNKIEAFWMRPSRPCPIPAKEAPSTPGRTTARFR